MAIRPDGCLEERIEELYVCDEYKVFFLTGQANNTGRKAFISAKAFHMLDDEQQAEMRKNATPWEEDTAWVRISANEGMLAFQDKFTGTISNVPWTELDDDVQQRLRGNNGGDPFLKYAGSPTKTARPIAVGKPLTLKRNP
jgi:hypothetical protein